jgi:hypothetical protein
MRRSSKDDAPRLSHNVYVVELDPAVLKVRAFRSRNPDRRRGMPCVYVGMTGLPPGERFQNHKAGVKANRFVRDFGKGLLPELFECFNPMPYAAAQRMEVELAEELRAKGYAVWQG